MVSTQSGVPTLQTVREAHARIRDSIHLTPIMTSSTFDAAAQATLLFKCENFQKVGAFKARGATNAIFLLSDEEAHRGVVTHSSGNHAAALARAARLRGIPANIVMPRNAPKSKQASVHRQGANVILCEPTVEARESTAASVIADTGATLIHPYDDWRVIAGQGTVALEMLEAVPDLDLILCPVGGGGLLSGTALVAKALRPDIRVVAVEPDGADDAFCSFRSGRLIPMVAPRTIADGLLTSLSDRTFAVINRYVDDIVTVSDVAIVQAMRMIWEVMKIIVEPSAAVAYAAIIEGRVPVVSQKVGLILTGGNLDLDTLPWVAPG